MPQHLAERVIFQKRMFTISDVDLDFEGKKATFQIFEKPNAAMVVALTESSNVLFLREYFAAIDRTQLGLPQGRIDDGETPEETAQRELQEEAGFKAGKLSKLGVLTISPGYIRQYTHVFLAQELKPSKLSGDELQQLEVVELPLDDVAALVKNGELTEARMIAALFLAQVALGR